MSEKIYKENIYYIHQNKYVKVKYFKDENVNNCLKIITYEKNLNKFHLKTSYKFNFLESKTLISKEEYEKGIEDQKLCNCKIGAGNDIQIGDQYDYEEVLEELLSLNIHKYNPDKYEIYFDVKNGYKTQYYLSYNNIETNNYIKEIYYKKACFKCETCLDEKHLLIEELTQVFTELDLMIEKKERKDYKIDQICNKI